MLRGLRHCRVIVEGNAMRLSSCHRRHASAWLDDECADGELRLKELIPEPQGHCVAPRSLRVTAQLPGTSGSLLHCALPVFGDLGCLKTEVALTSAMASSADEGALALFGFGMGILHVVSGQTTSPRWPLLLLAKTAARSGWAVGGLSAIALDCSSLL